MDQGVWRKACIDSAGGWSSDTLAEDLDLAFRAQIGVGKSSMMIHWKLLPRYPLI